MQHFILILALLIFILKNPTNYWINFFLLKQKFDELIFSLLGLLQMHTTYKFYVKLQLIILKYKQVDRKKPQCKITLIKNVFDKETLKNHIDRQKWIIAKLWYFRCRFTLIEKYLTCKRLSQEGLTRNKRTKQIKKKTDWRKKPTKHHIKLLPILYMDDRKMSQSIKTGFPNRYLRNWWKWNFCV